MEDSIASKLFERYKLDNRIEQLYPYGSGHVHVPGPKTLATIPTLEWLQSDQGTITTPEEERMFKDSGYFILKDAVPMGLVDRTKEYIEENYSSWQEISKRSDDWRCHFELSFEDLSTPIEHGTLLDLLFQSPKVMGRVTSFLGGLPAGIFYTQIALRTPIKKLKSPEHTQSLNSGGTDYHIDGQANDAGQTKPDHTVLFLLLFVVLVLLCVRFPDHWTLQVGIALSDQPHVNAGNFTVFPGFHAGGGLLLPGKSWGWRSYPEMKIKGTLPDLGEPVQLQLHAGDAVFAHVLLPHRGGRNVHRHGDPPEGYPRMVPWGTREMVYFRLKARGIDYASLERAERIFSDPLCEYQLIHTLRDIDESNDDRDVGNVTL